MAEISVCALALTAVKGTRLREVEQLTLGTEGVEENRRFFVIDVRDRMVNAKTMGGLTTLVADYSPEQSRLSISFPDGHVVEDELRLGEPITTRFYSDQAPARLVEGPWSGALSAYLDQPLRLVQAEGPGAGVDRGSEGAVSVISRASLARLAQEADESDIDPRRFRMLIEIDGVEAHAEDLWVGRRLRIGEALIAGRGHVGRCLITSRDPESGEIDLPTLDLLRGYRADANTTEPLPFGIYGEVLEAGAVKLRDPVMLEA
jgi:uncharacterized protein YcbX